MPVVLKEALLDPETDLVGIQRDYGSHISSVAEVLSELDCHPVFTERSEGTSLNVLFTIIESSLQDFTQTRSVQNADFTGIDMIMCDSSRVLRHSVSEALSLYGVDVRQAPDMESVRKLLVDSPSDCIVVDCPVLDEDCIETLRDISADYPNTSIVVTAGSSSGEPVETGSLPQGIRILQKPYSIDELLNIMEIISPGQSGMSSSFSEAEDTYGIQ
ncbi:MAG: response regulator [Candidatus Aegiribacteria sp.]|nr:response regulator [Candidatus Aegiribacteria sp.]MBD3295028.1 response regulator [Candidatus Fermentibacteria bacterium]